MKEELQKQVQEMKAKLDEMEALLLEPDVVINYFKPKINEDYFYINHCGNICNTYDTNNLDKKYRVFQIQKEAEKYAEYVKSEETLREAIAIANEGWLPDWNNRYQSQWFTYFNYYENSIETACSCHCRQQPNFMYCKTEKITQQIIKDYEKELITYYSY